MKLKASGRVTEANSVHSRWLVDEEIMDQLTKQRTLKVKEFTQVIEILALKKIMKNRNKRRNNQPALVRKCLTFAQIFMSLAGIKTIRQRRLPSQATIVMPSSSRLITYFEQWSLTDPSWMDNTTGRS